MSSILILGGGQYGRLASEIAAEQYDCICFLDDSVPLSETVVGRLYQAGAMAADFDAAVVAIGNNEVRKKYLDLLPNAVSLISNRAYVSPSAVVGAGCIIEPMAVLSSGAVLGKGCIVSSGAVINHDSVVGDACHIDCHATVGARSTVPAGTKIPYGQVWEARQEESI